MGYDDWLAQKTDEYLTGCEPEIIGCNEDNVPDYNCEGCLKCDCEHWEKYNDAG